MQTTGKNSTLFRTFWDVWKLQMLELWKGNWEFDPYVLEMPLPTAKLFLENRRENRRTTAQAVINTGSPWWCKDLTMEGINEWLLPSGYHTWRNNFLACSRIITKEQDIIYQLFLLILCGEIILLCYLGWFTNLFSSYKWI